MESFVSYDIVPVVHYSDGSAEAIDSLAVFTHVTVGERGVERKCWGLYGRLPNGEAGHVGDFPNYDAAVTMYQRITGVPMDKPFAIHTGLPNGRLH